MTIKEETLFTNEETANSKQLAILKKHFPQCFDKQGKFIQEKMLEVVQASDTELSQESYGLNWLGKSYAQLLTNLPPETLISADTDHNQKDQNKNSNNLLIKGDNLEVLNHMVYAYSEKIKMIYIDPPYNTGSDGFVYNDNRKFTKQQLSELAGIEEDEAERILNFTDKGSNSHSAWLTFIYPRLYIARELLREDGVIFISIDDNEVSQLKMLCDEVFGEGNFLAKIVWQRSYAPIGLKKHFSENHDFILIYSKKINTLKINLLPRSLKQDNDYKNTDNDPRGAWKAGNLAVGPIVESQVYEIITPTGRKTFPPKGYCWRYKKEKFEKLLKDNRISFGASGNNVPAPKIFLSEVRDGVVPMTVWTYNEVGHNQEATRELRDLFTNAVFTNPKPLRYLKRILHIGAKKTDIILDFFAGSGTTAHATMQLNAEDGGNRQCISVQIDELTDKKSEAFKAGYKTIFDITKARISKAGKKIQQENPEYKGDLGFKIYQTVEDFRDISDNEMVENCSDGSNIDVMPKKITSLPFIDDKKLTKSQYQALLTTWCLYDGALLTTRIDNITLADYQAHLCDKRLYLLATGFSTEALKALLLKLDEDNSFAPHKIIFYGNNFESATQRELNEAVTSYANKKSLTIELVVRY